MKKIGILLVALLISFSLDTFAKPASVSIQTNLTCGSCADKIQGAMKSVDGIDKTEVDVASKMVTVSFDDSKINTEKLTAKIAGLGYKAEVVEDGKLIKASSKECSTEAKEAKSCGTEKSCCKTKSTKKS